MSTFVKAPRGLRHCRQATSDRSTYTDTKVNGIRGDMYKLLRITLMINEG